MPQTSVLSQLNANITEQNRPATHDNALAFCVDNNYLPYALFVAHQFIAHHPDNPCDICICLPDISQIPQHLLSSSIRFVELQIEGMDNLPVGRLSLAAYHRLFLPQLFAEDYDYIIYLDADAYIMRPFYTQIMQLIQSYPEDFSVAAAADVMELKLQITPSRKFSKVESYVLKYHQHKHLYRNSGVLILNTKNYRQQDVLPRVFGYAFEHINELQCHDQSALNGALLHEIAILPFMFNWQVHSLTYELTDEFKPYIIHFIGNNKPWRLTNRYTQPFQESYQQFIEKNFPKQEFSVYTEYEKRQKQPKYDNSIRELISQKNILFQNFIDNKRSWLPYSIKNSKVRNLLKLPSFTGCNTKL
ncbi:glycosyltransferase family 8 protein [Psychrobacter sp. I-STPA6b]|uniref:glycosyltransferase family 8 protein n=1 Tax=Psychrobacter sp. I-STPA6b TaxID=2585718 RepID=UPI001D0C61D3|nr:glycosyltransferase [Psychrobacter sp. I-STPA6b]